MALLLIPLRSMRPFGLKELLEDEVFEMVKALESDKASVLDGFTMAFFQASWDVLEVDITNVFHDFCARGMFGKSCNVTFITL
jgi:hypothetical protein